MTAPTTRQLLDVLADETRCRILMLLEDRAPCVCEPTGALDLPQPTVSRHLMVMRDAGIVEQCKEGRYSFYRVARSAVPRGPQKTQADRRTRTGVTLVGAAASARTSVRDRDHDCMFILANRIATSSGVGSRAALGTVLAFMMSVIALLPEMVILRKVLKLRLIATFAAVVAAGILVVGYVFNLVL